MQKSTNPRPCKSLGNGAYKAPTNNLGITVVHWGEGPPPPLAGIRRMINGPLTAIEPKIRAELAKPVDERDLPEHA